jgi:hypothetical protein
MSAKTQQKLIHVVADYGPGDLAFPEMMSALWARLPGDWHIQNSSIRSFDTISTGFVVMQLGLQREPLRPGDTIIFANCAPRRDRREARHDNEGEGLLYGVLSSGVPVIAVNSGYSLSFVREDLNELWSVKVDRGGSQFRSRDIFPPIVGKVARQELDFMIEKLNPLKIIPEPPEAVIAYRDSFGNLKTSFRQGDKLVKNLTSGQHVKITINGKTASATVATGTFNVSEGDFAFAPGSSGHHKRFWEIFQRGGSAAEYFNNAKSGAEIVVAV